MKNGSKPSLAMLTGVSSTCKTIVVDKLRHYVRNRMYLGRLLALQTLAYTVLSHTFSNIGNELLHCFHVLLQK